MNPTARTAILRRFLEGCEPFRLAGPLSSLDTADFAGPADAGGLVAALAAEFGEDDLVACGVATRDGPGVAVAPALARPGGVIVVFRDADTGDPVGLATDDGLVGGGVAAVAATRDAVYAAAAAGGGRTVVATVTAADAAALRAFGLPASPAGDLSGASPADLIVFLEAFGFERRLSRRRLEEAEELKDLEEERRDREKEMRKAARAARAARAAEAGDAAADGDGDGDDEEAEDEEGEDDEEAEWEGPEIAFSAWSPATNDARRPEGLMPLLVGIERAARLLRFELYTLHVWAPDDPSHERLALFALHGDAAGVAETLGDSLYEHRTAHWRPVDAPAGGDGRPPAAGHAGGPAPGDLARTAADRLAGDLRRAAADAPLEERVLMLIMAEAYEVNAALGEVIRGSFAQSAARGAGVDPTIVPQVAQYHRSVKCIHALFKELRNCRSPRPGRNGRTILVQDPDRPALPPPSRGSD